MVWTILVHIPVHGKAEEATSSWISTGGVGMGKKMKSVVMVVSAVVLGHREIQMSPSSVRPQMDHRVGEIELFLRERKLQEVDETECKMDVKLPFLKHVGLDI